jgi:hypothetical protein
MEEATMPIEIEDDEPGLTEGWETCGEAIMMGKLTLFIWQRIGYSKGLGKGNSELSMDAYPVLQRHRSRDTYT